LWLFSLTYTYDYSDFVALVRAKRSLGPLGKLGSVTPYLVVTALYLALSHLALPGTAFQFHGFSQAKICSCCSRAFWSLS
jgi:hypothetical protein